MDDKKIKEEHLERLWNMQEEGKDDIKELEQLMPEFFDKDIVKELISEKLVNYNEKEDKISLTKTGKEYSRRLIRAHRIAERLLNDVLGGEFEAGACEFEHTVTPELVDSICTLLGHPRECPHGLPIPEGDCCRRSARVSESLVIPLTELKIGQSGRIAYINCRNDQRLHKLNISQIRPGVEIKIHQIYPAYVIECEGANIALDKSVVEDISVWREDKKPVLDKKRDRKRDGSKRRFWKKRFGFGKKPGF